MDGQVDIGVHSAKDLPAVLPDELKLAGVPAREDASDAYIGPAASLGWNAVATKVNATGQVEGTCVGTGMGWDPMFYMYRPTHVLAAHGYGPVFLAGAEMITLRAGKGADATMNGGLQFGKATSQH